MRNLFDQYEKPENRLTHALYCTLSKEPTLLRPFLVWLNVKDIPPNGTLKLVQQSVPGSAIEPPLGEDGLPDLCIYCEGGKQNEPWGVFFEMKVQAKLNVKQLERHKQTARRYGFSKPKIVAITVEQVESSTAKLFQSVLWRDIYLWFARWESRSTWAAELVRYMEIFESRMLDDQCQIRGAITMFKGLCFDETRPYSHYEAKRLVRLLGDLLQKRKDLEQVLDIDPKANRRPAITHDDVIWDYIPLKEGKGLPFNQLPHFTMSIQPRFAVAALTMPNSFSAALRKQIITVSKQEFIDTLEEILNSLHKTLSASSGSKAVIYATQRHFKSIKSLPEVDGRIEADLRTLVQSKDSSVKYQPQWIEAIYDVLLKKKSNIQCGIEVRFDYSCDSVRSPSVANLFAESWIAMRPFLNLALGKD